MITGQKYTNYSIIAISRLFIYFLHLVWDFLFYAIGGAYFKFIAISSILYNYFIGLHKIQGLDLFIRATFQTMYIINSFSIN